ncbi:MAG: hypothetical protein M1827_004821 [Pycnora praestabilis]|nr:MAG: hypothetical protein M1827_004821 [Pycnora praestabilis]
MANAIPTNPRKNRRSPYQEQRLVEQFLHRRAHRALSSTALGAVAGGSHHEIMSGEDMATAASASAERGNRLGEGGVMTPNTEPAAPPSVPPTDAVEDFQPLAIDDAQRTFPNAFIPSIRLTHPYGLLDGRPAKTPSEWLATKTALNDRYASKQQVRTRLEEIRQLVQERMDQRKREEEGLEREGREMRAMREMERRAMEKLLVGVGRRGGDGNGNGDM